MYPNGGYDPGAPKDGYDDGPPPNPGKAAPKFPNELLRCMGSIALPGLGGPSLVARFIEEERFFFFLRSECGLAPKNPPGAMPWAPVDEGHQFACEQGKARRRKIMKRTCVPPRVRRRRTRTSRSTPRRIPTRRSRRPITPRGRLRPKAQRWGVSVPSSPITSPSTSKGPCTKCPCTKCPCPVTPTTTCTPTTTAAAKARVPAKPLGLALCAEAGESAGGCAGECGRRGSRKCVGESGEGRCGRGGVGSRGPWVCVLRLGGPSGRGG